MAFTEELYRKIKALTDALSTLLGTPADTDVSTDIANIATTLGTPADTDIATDIAGIATTLTSIDNVPSGDSTDNASVVDVVGNKADGAIDTVGTTKSLMAYTKGLISMMPVFTVGAQAGSVEASATLYIPTGRIITTLWVENNSLELQMSDGDAGWQIITSAGGLWTGVVACDGASIKLIETGGAAPRKYAYMYVTFTTAGIS